MHSVNNPDEEAHRLYIEQSALSTRLADTEVNKGELVVWDVGLGAATNAMAVVRCYESARTAATSQTRPLRLVSFECDLDPLRLASSRAGYFPHVRHPAPQAIITKGHWTDASGGLRWELLQGDFLNHLDQAPPPDLIYYDPFSLKTNSALWTTATFSRILAACAPKPAELYTYSAATAVRVALLHAGFMVAAGVGTGPKADTTIAFSRADGAAFHPQDPTLLGDSWLARWRRSDAKSPATLAPDARTRFEQMIEQHPQFSRRDPMTAGK